MNGFRNESLNLDFESGIFDLIVAHVEKCCEEMKTDCIKTSDFLCNHEDRITDRFVEKHLNTERNIFRFILQAPENFVSDEDRYKGRTDIKIVTNSWFDNQRDYYTIECKRIDGESDLNKKYVSEGVARFIEDPPLYSSYHSRNIMLGYVVNIIDIPNNTAKIDQLQKDLIKDVIIGGFTLIKNANSDYYLYFCQYKSSNNNIELRHLFYDFSSVIEKPTS